MEILTGKRKIAKFLGRVDLYIDYDDLFKYGGLRKIKNQVDKRLGNVLILVTTLAFIVYLFFRASDGSEGLVSLDILPFIFLTIISYASYLKRDKDEFGFNYDDLSLKHTREQIEKGLVEYVEIENYLSESLVELIDFEYFRNNDPVLAIGKSLIKDPGVSKVLKNRLGIEPSELLKQLVSMDKYSLNQLILDFFEEGVLLNLDKINKNLAVIVFAKKIFKEQFLNLGISEVEVLALEGWLVNVERKKYYAKIWKRKSRIKSSGSINRAYTSKATPTLDRLGQDFTNISKNEGFSLTIGKEKLMLKVLSNIDSFESNPSLIVAKSGVGKTHFLKHLATKMVLEDVPESIKDSRLVVLNLSQIFSLSEGLSDFEKTIHQIFQEIKSSGFLVIVLEEIGQIFNLRDDAKKELFNLLENEIDDLHFKLLATSKLSDYNRYLKTNPAFLSLFEVLELNEPPLDISTQILIDDAEQLSEKSGISYNIKQIKEIAKFSDKINDAKGMPEKGIEALSNIFKLAIDQNLNHLSGEIIQEYFKTQFGTNVGDINKDESQKIQKLESEIHKSIVGQEQAVESVVAAIKRARSGINEKENKPVASFLFYGPTGVGKTEVSKQLAKVYFGEVDKMIRLDMSEFSDSDSVKRLIGYVDENNDFKEGRLTGQVKEKPYSLILLDEIEKADTKIFDLFLQILDEGFITDGNNEKISFSDNIIIATSNAASKPIAGMLLKGAAYKEIEKSTKNKLQEYFRVEFLNRFDGIIMFKPLSKPQIEKIINIKLDLLAKDLLESKNIKLHWDAKTVYTLLEEGYDNVYGARAINRVITEEIENKIADLIVKKEIKRGSTVEFKGLKIYRIY